MLILFIINYVICIEFTLSRSLYLLKNIKYNPLFHINWFKKTIIFDSYYFFSFLQALKFPLFKYLTIIKIFLDVKFENLNANWNDIQIGILTIILLLHWWTNYYLAYFLVSCYIKLKNTMPHTPIKILVNNK